MQTGRQPDSAGGTNSNQAYLAATELLKRVDKPGNIDRAIEELKRILASEPRNALAAAGLARAYWLQYGAKREPKFLTMAKEASDLALGINPKLAPVHATLGKIQARMGNTDLADQELQQALALDPRSADVWSAMGDLYDSQGRKQQAEEAIQKAMALAPDDWRYANQMGLFQAAHGSPAQGIEAYREAARLTPDNYLPLNNLGIAYRNQGNLVEAEKALRRAVAINPGNRTYTNLGNVLSDAGRFGEAAEAYQQALRLNGASYLTWGNLAACYRRDGAPAAKVREAYQEAATRAEAERAAAPKDAVLAAMLGTYRLWLGERPRALQLARQAVALDGENPAVLVAAAEVFAHTGDRVEAISLLGGALAHGASKEEIARNRELEPLRGEPRFRALIGRNE